MVIRRIVGRKEFFHENYNWLWLIAIDWYAMVYSLHPEAQKCFFREGLIFDISNFNDLWDLYLVDSIRQKLAIFTIFQLCLKFSLKTLFNSPSGNIFTVDVIIEIGKVSNMMQVHLFELVTVMYVLVSSQFYAENNTRQRVNPFPFKIVYGYCCFSLIIERYSTNFVVHANLKGPAFSLTFPISKGRQAMWRKLSPLVTHSINSISKRNAMSITTLVRWNEQFGVHNGTSTYF